MASPMGLRDLECGLQLGMMQHGAERREENFRNETIEDDPGAMTHVP